MGVKSLAFLGIIVSSIFIFLCIHFKKDLFYASIAQKDKNAIATQPIVQEVANKESKPIAFSYINDKVAAILSTKEKEDIYLKEICKDERCKDRLKFSEDVNRFKLMKNLADLIELSSTEGVDKFTINIKEKKIAVNGIVKEDKTIQEFDSRLLPFSDSGFEVVNGMKIKHLEAKLKKTPEENKTKDVILKSEVIENHAKPVKEKSNEQNKSISENKQQVAQKSQIVEKLSAKKEEIKNKEKKQEKKAKEIKKESPKIVKSTKKIVKAKTQAKRKKVVKTVNRDKKVPDLFIVQEKIDLQEARDRILNLQYSEPIEFDIDSNHLNEESKMSLRKIADILKSVNVRKITIKGYTSQMSDGTFSKVLSQNRADTVKKFLVSEGVSRSLIRSIGYADSDPIAEPTSEINDRVEIDIE